jgi:hypothetical protein
MDFHALVTGYIVAINPFLLFTIENSTGFTTNPDGSRTPTYLTVTALGQLQAATFSDLREVEGLNQGGISRTIYFEGEIDAIIRVVKGGGAIIKDPLGRTWLVHLVLEQWPDWCKLGVVLQDDDGGSLKFLPFIPSVG